MRRSHEPAKVGEIALQEPVCARLHEDIADRRRLDRTGDDREPARVGGQLAEQFVAAPAADQVDDVDRSTRQPDGIANG
jgi:hypothetical protein